MSDSNIVNPGLVNVADQADGMVKKDQPVTVSPSSNAGPITQGGDLAPGRGVAATDPPDVTPAMTAQRNVDGGTFSPASPGTINTTQNTVITQPASVQQFSRTINVNV
jgi:hypothetical protein